MMIITLCIRSATKSKVQALHLSSRKMLQVQQLKSNTVRKTTCRRHARTAATTATWNCGHSSIRSRYIWYSSGPSKAADNASEAADNGVESGIAHSRAGPIDCRLMSLVIPLSLPQPTWQRYQVARHWVWQLLTQLSTKTRARSPRRNMRRGCRLLQGCCEHANSNPQWHAGYGHSRKRQWRHCKPFTRLHSSCFNVHC